MTTQTQIHQGLLVVLLIAAITAPAQITLDGTMGRAGALSGPQFTIGAELGRQSGANLFHSFGQFNILRGETATFTGPAGISNILARITGGSLSLIDGTLGSTIEGANLFLLNPSGVLFGPNASVLNVRGSLSVGTADYLRLADGSRLYVDPNQTSTLTAAPPEAFGFLSKTPAAVTVSGSKLSMGAGASFTVAGGAVNITGADGQQASIDLSGGDLRLASVGSGAEVRLTPNFAVDGPANGSTVLVRDAALSVNDTGAAGRVLVRGGRFVMEGAALIKAVNQRLGGGGLDIAATEAVSLNTREFPSLAVESSGDAAAGLLSVRAPLVSMSGEAGIDMLTRGTGAGGDIALDVGSLQMTGGAAITSGHRSSGPAGAIQINASDAIVLTDTEYAAVWSETQSNSNGGDIRINTPRLEVNASEIYTGSESNGTAGQIAINAGTVAVENGSRIQSRSAKAGSGASGSLSIVASESISVLGTDPTEGIETRSDNASAAGNITISAPNIELRGAGVRSSAYGTGNGGNIELTGRAVRIEGGSIVSEPSETGLGSGGSVTLGATESVKILAGEKFAVGINTSTFGSGDAGAIRVTAPRVEVEGISMRAETNGGGRGGDISINADEFVLHNGGRVDASASRGGDAGSVAIGAGSVRINSAYIDAGTAGAGRGGDIQIEAGAVLLEDEGTITSSTTGSGRGGDINIRAALVRAEDSIVHSAAAGSGDAGEITLAVGDLELLNGSIIGTPTLQGTDSGSAETPASPEVDTGAGGKVTIKADRSVLIHSGLLGTSGVLTATRGAGRAGDIVISAPSLRIVDGIIASGTLGDGDAGNINISVSELELLNGGHLQAATYATGKGGSLNVTADRSITIQGRTGEQKSTLFTNSTGQGAAGNVHVSSPTIRLIEASIKSSTESGGDAGSIHIEAEQLEILDASEIHASTAGSGAAGDVAIDASRSITMMGRESDSAPSLLWSGSNGSGRGGNVSINSPNIQLVDSYMGSCACGTGNAGDVTIQTSELELLRGGQLQSLTGAAGSGGRITINASRAVTLRGRDAHGFASGLFTTTNGDGRGGNITITSPSVTVDDGLITSETFSSGRAGDVALNVGRLELNNGGSIRGGTRGSGAGGVLSVSADESVRIFGISNYGGGLYFSGLYSEAGSLSTGGAGSLSLQTPRLDVLLGRIETSSYGFGRAGDIKVTARNVQLALGGFTSQSSLGQAGNIDIDVEAALRSNFAVISTDSGGGGGNITIRTGTLLDLAFSLVTTKALTFSNNAGNIWLSSPQSILARNSVITATAEGGNGGTINIQSGAFLNFGSTVEAHSKAGGISGQIDIRAPVRQLSDRIIPLPSDFLRRSLELRAPCDPRQGPSGSTFLVKGQPCSGPLPSGFLPPRAPLSLNRRMN